MKAIILAAGIGKRLGPASYQKPKCLLSFDGVSLLQRHLAILEYYDICEVCIITGYESGQIAQALPNLSLSSQLVYNVRYQQGSVVSLWSAQAFLTSGDGILLMDADVLYDHKIIGTLVNTAHRNCFLLDRNFEAGDEPVKLCISNGRLVEFRKNVAQEVQFDQQGESVGFFRFSGEIAGILARQTQHYIDTERLDEPYEEVIRDLLLEQPDSFAYEDVTGLPWIEIDFPEDIDRATQDILPRLSKMVSA
ncbi:MAG: ADP-glucose pyrophosphorylase [Gammaproteobacteria bacterium RBG_16_51_14]|nr:MAG: ADP-glucose pyrophosphorylase [Gammaproteobacteria bacterium RBG_16_51_14]